MPTGPDEVCDAHPHAPPTSADPEVSADILLMEQTVGQYIRDNGNPAERDLYDMLKKLKHRYTQKQIRLWKKHFGNAAAATGSTDVPCDVSADIVEMECEVGQFIRDWY